MSEADNHAWDTRTLFSDDPFGSAAVTPDFHDDLKFNGGNVQAKIYH
jgi:hypothetical protein